MVPSLELATIKNGVTKILGNVDGFIMNMLSACKYAALVHSSYSFTFQYSNGVMLRKRLGSLDLGDPDFYVLSCQLLLGN